MRNFSFNGHKIAYLSSLSSAISLRPIQSIASPPQPRRLRFVSSKPFPAMDLPAYVERLRGGSAASFPADANSLEFAQEMDSQDSLRHLRQEFNLPTKTSIKKTVLDGTLPCRFICASSPCMVLLYLVSPVAC